MCRKKSFTFLPAFVFIDFYKDDVTPDLADTLPRNDKLGVTSKKGADASRTGQNQGGNTASAVIDFHIADTAKRPAGTGVDDFFLAKFADAHGILQMGLSMILWEKSAVYALTVKIGFDILQINKLQPGGRIYEVSVL